MKVPPSLYSVQRPSLPLGTSCLGLSLIVRGVNHERGTD